MGCSKGAPDRGAGGAAAAGSVGAWPHVYDPSVLSMAGRLLLVGVFERVHSVPMGSMRIQGGQRVAGNASSADAICTIRQAGVQGRQGGEARGAAQPRASQRSSLCVHSAHINHRSEPLEASPGRASSAKPGAVLHRIAHASICFSTPQGRLNSGPAPAGQHLQAGRASSVRPRPSGACPAARSSLQSMHSVLA